MQKANLARPISVMLYGYPGSGKSFFARQASELLEIPHISSDRIRYELFEKPSFSKDEQVVVLNLMYLMLEEFSKHGMSAIFDISLNRAIDRKTMREFSKSHGMQHLLIWVQADRESCLYRASGRDRRKTDDKYAHQLSEEQFKTIEETMQQPQHEDALVISGKHLFESQKHVFMRRLREMQLLVDTELTRHAVPKPELVNLVSQAQRSSGRVDPSRRNVLIS